MMSAAQLQMFILLLIGCVRKMSQIKVYTRVVFHKGTKPFDSDREPVLGVYMIRLVFDLFEQQRAKLIRLDRQKRRLKPIQNIVRPLFFLLVLERKQTREIIREYNFQIVGPLGGEFRGLRETRMKRHHQVRFRVELLDLIRVLDVVAVVSLPKSHQKVVYVRKVLSQVGHFRPVDFRGVIIQHV